MNRDFIRLQRQRAYPENRLLRKEAFNVEKGLLGGQGLLGGMRKDWKMQPVNRMATLMGKRGLKKIQLEQRLWKCALQRAKANGIHEVIRDNGEMVEVYKDPKTPAVFDVDTLQPMTEDGKDWVFCRDHTHLGMKGHHHAITKNLVLPSKVLAEVRAGKGILNQQLALGY